MIRWPAQGNRGPVGTALLDGDRGLIVRDRQAEAPVGEVGGRQLPASRVAAQFVLGEVENEVAGLWRPRRLTNFGLYIFIQAQAQGRAVLKEGRLAEGRPDAVQDLRLAFALKQLVDAEGVNFVRIVAGGDEVPAAGRRGQGRPVVPAFPAGNRPHGRRIGEADNLKLEWPHCQRLAVLRFQDDGEIIRRAVGLRRHQSKGAE